MRRQTSLATATAVMSLALLVLFIVPHNDNDSQAFAAELKGDVKNTPSKLTQDSINVDFVVPSVVFATENTPVKIKVTDSQSGKPLSHVDWAISVKDPDGNIVYKTTTAHSHAGIMDFNVAFPMAGENTITLTASSIGSKMMGMDVPPMARTHTIMSSLMTFEQDPENDFGSRNYELPVYVLKQQQSVTLDGSEPGKQIKVTLASSTDKIVAGQPSTLILTVTQPNGEMLTHPDALISVRKGFYKVSQSAEPGDPMMPMNGAYHGHLGQMSYTAAFPNAGNYVINVDLNSLPVSNYQFGHTSARFNILVMESNGDVSSEQSQPKNTVKIVGLESPFYQPNNIEVSKGTAIVFDNVDGNFHTVTSGNSQTGPNGTFDSGLIKTGDTYKLNLDKPGTFEYYCTIHTNMVGTITVS
jgi:plastocyanin